MMLAGLAENRYYVAGAAISLSLLHGGPVPRCLSSTFYKVLCHQSIQPSLVDVHDATVRMQFQQVRSH